MQLYYETVITYTHRKDGRVGSYTFFRKLEEDHAREWCTNNDLRYVCSTINRIN